MWSASSPRGAETGHGAPWPPPEQADAADPRHQLRHRHSYRQTRRLPNLFPNTAAFSAVQHCAGSRASAWLMLCSRSLSSDVGRRTELGAGEAHPGGCAVLALDSPVGVAVEGHPERRARAGGVAGDRIPDDTGCCRAGQVGELAGQRRDHGGRVTRTAFACPHRESPQSVSSARHLRSSSRDQFVAVARRVVLPQVGQVHAWSQVCLGDQDPYPADALNCRSWAAGSGRAYRRRRHDACRRPRKPASDRLSGPALETPSARTERALLRERRVAPGAIEPVGAQRDHCQVKIDRRIPPDVSPLRKASFVAELDGL
ncbi:hypothetical protein SAMN04489732_110287 [Amycolatopsis saalfeldensis]|uniref:Uncharacterized protein n=1 Tax=Amycolatopsis saalfeldensis TaxID=394193 RepID=A0A1H8Y3I7_9PSEU|nr:hypothetical protein SAMN04489732_110287 [Amycolatopsis saalfeldensis]